MNYSEKLKDPRWKLKRLNILNRDNFTCQNCESTRNELHVHHLLYRFNIEPWDYPDEDFLTLCDECHREETLRTTAHQNREYFNNAAYKIVSQLFTKELSLKLDWLIIRYYV